MTKNPCLHPGDIRVLEAVWVEELASCVRDCIVFSTAGARPNFNEMAGSDLDGDQYWVYWGDELRVNQVEAPLQYPPAQKKEDVTVTNELLVDHILNSMTNGEAGIIGNTHKVIADKHPAGTRSAECVECAALFARAIDAPKTGEQISMRRIEQLREMYCQTYPEWMMNFNKPVMDPPSKSINEILFRRAQNAWLNNSSYEDILRPLSGVQVVESPLAIDVDDGIQADDEDGKRNCCSRCFSMICSLLILLVVVAAVLKMMRKI